MSIEGTEQDVLRVSAERAAAELRGDTRVLRQLIADDFVGVGPRGFTLTKQEWLSRLDSGDLAYDALTCDDVHIRIHGDCAVAIGRETSRLKYNGKQMQGQFRETQVFTKQDGRWLLSSLQLSEMAGPPTG
jgi:ketosteroid isomerase-like protein